MIVHASTAMFPGVPLLNAVELLHSEVLSEPLLGPISTAHIQLCPQNPTQITKDVCDELLALYPDTRFRLHANAHVMPQRVIIDASGTIHSKPNFEYFNQLAIVSQWLNAPAYSLHAGYKKNSNMQGMLNNVKRIANLFGDIPVAVEGLYRDSRNENLMDELLHYEMAYQSGVNIALDLSHLKIVARRTPAFSIQVVKDMLESSQTLEIHLSDNDGTRDSHVPLTDEPFWWDILHSAKLHNHTVIFTEGNQRKL